MSGLIETLNSYVPQLITRHLITDPTPITEPASERFPAAVLFADISGFTALTERLAEQGPAGAEILTRELNRYFGQLIAVITGHGGDVVKFAGDALTAIWPAPETGLSEATQQAAACALAIQAALQNYQTTGGLKLAIKIGLGVGNMAVAYVGGVYGRWEFLVVGPPLNQANRAEVLAQPGQVVVSSEAWALLEPHASGQSLNESHVHLTGVTQGRPANLTPLAKLPVEFETSLRAYIPGAILSRLAAGQSGWLAELRRVTVLFINLPDLTYATPLEQGQAAMRILQTALYRYEGSVNKISVDDKGATLVAAFGLPPLTHEDDANRAVRAARAAQTALQTMAWRCAIGVTTGRAYCGSVGSDIRREYTMIGDVVNLSARLMQAAGLPLAEGHVPILCDEPTYRAARTQLSFNSLSPITVKGKAEPVAIYRPTLETHTPQSQIVNPAVSAPAKSKIEMVGRVAERMTLASSLQKLQRGHSGVIIIEGEAGIGKSRLVADLLEQAQVMELKYFLGAGDAIEKTTTYHAWSLIYRQLFGLTEITDTHAAQQQIRVQLAALDPALAEQTPLLSAVLPFNFADNDASQILQGQVRAAKTRALLVQVLAAASNGSPLLLVIEDAHWLDSASWALLHQVQHEISPLLLVMATRPLAQEQSALVATPIPAEYQQLVANPQTQQLALTVLPLDDILTLVCQRLGVAALPPPVANFVLERTEGHPFFSEELAYALRDAGLINIRDGVCRLAAEVGDLQTLDFPDTLQGVITSRIDRLTPQQQLALKVASVIGRVFTLRLLQEVHPIEADKPVLTLYLEALHRLDLTPVESPEPELAYIFKHIITQEVAYNLMSFEQRRQLHQAVATWYEQAHQAELAPFYPLLAHHWHKVAASQRAEAAVVLKAIDYLRKAGEQAAQRSANVEAISHLNMALELLQSLPATPEQARQEFALQLALSGPLITTKGYAAPETIRTFDRAQQLAAQIGDTSQVFPLLYGRWVTHIVKAENQTAWQVAEQFLALAQQQPDTGPLLMAHRVLGNSHLIMGGFPAGRNALEQALALFEPEQHQELTFRFGQHPGAAIHSFLAWPLWLLGYPDRALHASDKAINIARSLNHINTLCYVLFLGGAVVHQYRRDVERVEKDTRAIIELAEQQGLALWLAYATVLHGWTLVERGQPAAGVSQIRQGLIGLQATNTKLCLSHLLSLLVEGYVALGQFQEGLTVMAEALAFVEETHERYWEAELYRLKGELLLKVEAKAKMEAEECFWQAIKIARRQEAKSLELRAVMSLSRLWQSQAKKAEACQMLAGIFGWFSEGFETPDLIEAKALLEELSQ